MTQQMQQPNELIEQLDVLGDLIKDSEEIDLPIAQAEMTPLNAYLDSVKHAMEKFQQRATELSSHCAEAEVAIKKGLSRITYGLFSLGIAMSVISNMLLITLGGTLLQLALCNFGTMIIFVLAGVCLLNDITNRDRIDGGQATDIYHRTQSISDNVDQLSRLTFNWNQKLQELEQKERQSESAIHKLESEEQQLSARIELKEGEFQQTQDDCERQQSVSLALKTEIINLEGEMAALLQSSKAIALDKENVEQELSELRNTFESVRSEKVACESELLAKRNEIEGFEIYSQQVQREIMDAQKEISELDVTSEGLTVGIEDKKLLLENIQNKIDSLLEQEHQVQERILEVELRLEEVCVCEVRHRDLNSIQSSIAASQNQIDENTRKIESLERSRIELEDAVIELETTEKTLSIGVELLRIDFQEQSQLVDQKAEYLDSLTDHEMRLQKEIDELVANLTSHKLQEAIQSDFSECELLLAAKREEMIELQTQSESLRDEIHVLGREASELQRFVEEFESHAEQEMGVKLESHNRTIEEKLRSIQDKTAQIELLGAQEMEAREKLEAAESELTTTRSQTLSAQLAATAIEEAIAEAQVKLTSIEMDQTRKEGQSVLLDSQLDLKIGELDMIEKSIEEASARELALKTLCEDADGRIAVLAEKSECLAEHLGTMMVNLEELDLQKENAEQALDDLNRLVVEKTNQVNVLEAVIADRELNIAVLQTEYASKDELRLAQASELAQLSNEILESKASIEDLKDVLNNLQYQRETISRAVQDHKSELDQVLTRKEDAIAESQRIHASIQLGKTKLDENERAFKHCLNEVLAAEAKLAKTTEAQILLQAESHQLSVAIHAAKAKLSSIESEIASANLERDDCIQEAKRVQQECDELSNTKNSLDIVHNEIQLRIAADRRELAECEADIARAEDLSQEIAALQSSSEQINRHSQSLTEKVGLLDHECQSKENELDRIIAELKRFEILMAKSEKAFSETNQRCESAKNQLVEMEGRKASTRKELDQLEQSSSKSKLAADAIAHELLAIEKNRDQAQVELQKYSSEVVEAQAVCRQWQEYGEMLKRTNQELEMTQKTLERQVQTLNVEQKNAEYALQQNVLAVKNSASQRDKLSSEIEGLEGKRRDLVHSEEALKHSLESKRALLNELDTELDRSRMNTDNATLEFEQLRLKCKAEKSQLTTLVAQHDELLREISNRSELHEQQTRRCDDLKSQEQSLTMKLAQVKEKIQVFQEQEKIYSEKRAQWEALDANYSKRSIEMDNLVHALTMNREQLASLTKELNDYQSQIGLNQIELDDVLVKLNKSKLQFASESGRQKELLADLASDLQTKQTSLQQTNAALQATSEKLVRAENEFADLSERMAEAEESLSMIDSKKSSVQEEKAEIEKTISELSKTCQELNDQRVETLAAVEVIEQQRNVAQAESFNFVQSHLALRATEETLVQGCQILEQELHAKRELLEQTVLQISAGEQQVFETLQAITLIGQQREGALTRLASDREAIDQARKGLEILQIQKLECESSVLHFQSEVARLAASRDRLAEDLRAFEAQRQATLETAISKQEPGVSIAEKDEVVVVEPVTSLGSGLPRQAEIVMDELEMLANAFANNADSSGQNVSDIVAYSEADVEFRSDEISSEDNIVSDLEQVMQSISQSIEELNIRDESERDDCIEDDAWDDLLRVVRVA